ncbi:unnamed protein product [Strongylus vulgaris]|uniref:C-terminal of Roc COR-B domain-containing protein n=1 Tax=Strongylus vulgaris TaxID=40348 RepID=A0A3P7JCD3_STRVU|nr:unnamed protein product [Strongylus vulgaris]
MPAHQPLTRTVGVWPSSIEHAPLSPQKSLNGNIGNEAIFTFTYSPEKQLRRVYAMSYIPTGFWSRLMTSSSLKAEVRNLDYTCLDFRIRDEQKRWRTFPLDQYALIELLVPQLSATVVDVKKMSITTEGEGSTRLLALVVDLLDTLLEDWYPAIGTRFVHSSEGDLLVNRFVPCSKCACDIAAEAQRAHDDAEVSHRKSSSERAVRGSKTTGDISTLYVIHCFSIEECMLAGREYGWLECPSHGGVRMRDIAPDTVFVDIESSLVIAADQLRRGRLLGRGAFGFVFRATVKLQ